MKTQEWRGRGSPGALGHESHVRMESVRAGSKKWERRDIVLRKCRRIARLRPFHSNSSFLSMLDEGFTDQDETHTEHIPESIYLILTPISIFSNR